MSAVSKVKSFLFRHKNKFLIGGAVIAGSVFLTKYAQQRLREWQEKETIDFLERNRKMNHFESIGRTCNETIVNLSLALADEVFREVDTDNLILYLKENPENKLEIWDSLKTAVFTKASMMIYSTVMLAVTLKVQLSIIGGYLYKNPTSISSTMQEQYLTICQQFITSGTKQLLTIVQNEVKKCVEAIPLNKKMKLSDIEAVFWAIQSSLASHDLSPIEEIRKYFFTKELNHNSEDMFDILLRDTADFLESDEIKSVTTHCVNRAFVLLGDQISEFYDQKQPNGSVFINPFEGQKPLAKLLPIINGLLSKQSFGNSLVQQLIVSQKLQALSANIYESLL